MVAKSDSENEGQMTEPLELASPNKHSHDIEKPTWTNIPRGTRASPVPSTLTTNP